MIIANYIVPIYSEDKFNGTGFIVENLLITAAHVVISEGNVCNFLYKGEMVSISSNNNIIFDYPKEGCKQGQNNLYLDLAIYRLKDIFSPLKLCAPKIKETCIYQGFTDSTLKLDVYTDIALNENAYFYPPEYDAKPIRINNCYNSVIGKCTHGNSGGPLFQGDYIIGMLSGGQQWHNLSWDRIIKAEHILKRIQEQ